MMKAHYIYLLGQLYKEHLRKAGNDLWGPPLWQNKLCPKFHLLLQKKIETLPTSFQASNNNKNFLTALTSKRRSILWWIWAHMIRAKHFAEYG